MQPGSSRVTQASLAHARTHAHALALTRARARTAPTNSPTHPHWQF